MLPEHIETNLNFYFLLVFSILYKLKIALHNLTIITNNDFIFKLYFIVYWQTKK